MIEDKDCTTMLCIAGSTGAAIVDMDFFEALGFRHYRGSSVADDKELRELYIDRTYDTHVDEEQLRICDSTTKEIADSLEPRGQRRWGKIFEPVPAGEPR